VSQSNFSLPWIVGLSAPKRLLIAIVVAFLAFLLPQLLGLDGHLRLLVAWIAGSGTYLGFAWATISRADPSMTRIRAQVHDQSGFVIFALVFSAATASFVAIGYLVGDFKAMPIQARVGHLALSISALVLSWLLIQTLFAFHYARWYYSREAGAALHAPHRGGLRFPDDRDPDYLDFAYYSFVVGMTSQVSDVCVTTRQMRRLTLIHGVLAFIFNIAILAMSINIIGSVI
jgi:uncharacterized membrane protein